jgi:hypothetical protein
MDMAFIRSQVDAAQRPSILFAIANSFSGPGTRRQYDTTEG